jgi:hypothetical protein
MAREFITIDASALKSFNYSEFLADYYSTTGTGSNAGVGTFLGGEYSEFAASIASGSQWNVQFAEAGNDRNILVEGDDMQYDGVVDGTVHGYSGTIKSIEFGYKYSQTSYDEVEGVSRSELYNLGHGLKISGLDVSAEYGDGFGPTNEMYTLMNQLRHSSATFATYIEALYELFGSKAQNFIGSRNSDVYVGTEFADRISGGKGVDELDGGDGKDVFFFNTKLDSGKTNETADTILNFVLADDRFNLHAIDAIAGKKGNQDFTWIGTKDFTGKAGQLNYERVDGETYVNIDINGDKTSDMTIHLDGDFKLTADHFIL